MENKYWTIFVSRSGRCDDSTYQLWVETDKEDIYNKALAAVEPNGWKVAKIYKPTELLAAPDFSKAVNRIK